MKHTFQWILAVVCFFIASDARVMADGEKEEDVKIPILIGTGKPYTGDIRRDISVVPFAAYYQNGTIYVSTSAEFSSITVDVVNETTGQVWNSTTDISDGMGEISISDGGVGSYTIEIVTEYGECFTGNFRL